MRSKPTPETGAATIDATILTATGRTLREALANARRQFGDRACIVETRSVTRRVADGLGHERLIEVSVCPAPTTDPVPAPAPRAEWPHVELSAAIVSEVERIEALVASLAQDRTVADDARATGFDDYPLGKRLLAAGASLPAARHLRRLYLAERGVDRAVTAEDHLRGLMRTSGGDWTSLAGCHLFLGAPGSGRTDLVLAAAARLKALGRRLLVLSFAPRHRGEVKRLQEEAAARGYDAAILKDAAQLTGGLDYFAQYDVVLIDTPALDGPVMSDPELHDLLSNQEDVHRHMMLPLDTDTMERERVWREARDWNCDWLALSRVDRTSCPGKLVDVLLAAPMALSLLAGGPWPGPAPEIAVPDALLSRILSGTPAARAADAH